MMIKALDKRQRTGKPLKVQEAYSVPLERVESKKKAASLKMIENSKRINELERSGLQYTQEWHSIADEGRSHVREYEHYRKNAERIRNVINSPKRFQWEESFLNEYVPPDPNLGFI